MLGQNHVNSTVNIVSSKRDEASKRRSEMFTIEKQRQIDQIPRVNKIEVQYKGIPEDVTLYMNKGLSTPFNVAQRKYLYVVLYHTNLLKNLRRAQVFRKNKSCPFVC